MSFNNEVEIKIRKSTKHWPQYIAGVSAASGAFVLGTVLGKKLTSK
jgi:hypothetical protein